MSQASIRVFSCSNESLPPHHSRQHTWAVLRSASTAENRLELQRRHLPVDDADIADIVGAGRAGVIAPDGVAPVAGVAIEEQQQPRGIVDIGLRIQE